MPLYDYTGQLDNGAALQGTLEAESQEAAAQKLTDIGVRVAGLRAAQRFAFVTPLTLDDFLFLNEQIAGLSKAEVPLERGLRDLAADAASPKLKRLLLELAADLDRGTSLVDALERQKRRFPTDYAAIVRAGLATGDLGGALYGLTVQLRLRSSFRRSVLEMAAYPLTVVVMLLVIMGIAMRFIVPMMEDVFDDFGARLPGLTQLVLDAAHSWWLVELTLGVLLLLVVLFFGWPAHGTLRRLRENGHPAPARLRPGILVRRAGAVRAYDGARRARRYTLARDDRRRRRGLGQCTPSGGDGAGVRAPPAGAGARRRGR